MTYGNYKVVIWITNGEVHITHTQDIYKKGEFVVLTSVLPADGTKVFERTKEEKKDFLLHIWGGSGGGVVVDFGRGNAKRTTNTLPVLL